MFAMVDFLKDLIVFQRVVRLRMSWARPLQGFSIVFFIIATPPKFLHGVDLAVVIVSTLALEVVTAITMLVSVVAPITIVIATVPNVAATSKVVMATVVAVLIVSWRVWCFASALVQQLLGVVGIRILLSGGEEVDHRYRPFTKELIPEIIMVAQTSNEGFNSLIVGDPGNPDAHIREMSDVLAQWFVPGVTDALQIILVAWLFTGSNEVFNKGLTQSIPGVELVLRETDKPLVPHRVDHHGKVISHDVLVTHSRSASGLVKLDP
jgi:hypothetical protein